jgi:outer membrane protein TolC
MKLLVFILVQLLLLGATPAQNPIEQVLQEIERNNSTLTVLKNELEAKALLNKTGIYLKNPEVEYSWNVGSPAITGNKTGLSLIQSFDFPTTYLHQARVSNALNQQLLSEYEYHRGELLFEARLLCLELVFCNAQLKEYKTRLQISLQITEAYSRLLEEGETNLIEANKAKLNFLNLEKEAQKLGIKRDAIYNELAAMNGGQPITLNQTEFGITQELIPDFEVWYQKVSESNPALEWQKQEVEISEKEISLRKAKNLPGFHLGYSSELLSHEKFRGFVIGVSIPLWENKNMVKYARAKNAAASSLLYDQSTRYYNFLKGQHAKAIALQEMVNQYRLLLKTTNNTTLAYRAWEAGEMSLTECLLEQTFHFNSVDKMLETELELHKTIAVLNKYP